MAYSMMQIFCRCYVQNSCGFIRYKRMMICSDQFTKIIIRYKRMLRNIVPGC